MKTQLFHIMTVRDFNDFLEEGIYRPPSLEADGFIHFSYAAQVSKVAARFYANISELVVLEVIESHLGDKLIVESALTHEQFEESKSELFPHLYRELRLSEVNRFANVKKDKGEEFPSLSRLDFHKVSS